MYPCGPHTVVVQPREDEGKEKDEEDLELEVVSPAGD
jgi:hypothetical protein